ARDALRARRSDAAQGRPPPLRRRGSGRRTDLAAHRRADGPRRLPPVRPAPRRAADAAGPGRAGRVVGASLGRAPRRPPARGAALPPLSGPDGRMAAMSSSRSRASGEWKGKQRLLDLETGDLVEPVLP